MSKVVITLTDEQDDQGIDRILTRVQFVHRQPLKGKSTKAEMFGLALAELVQQQSSRNLK